LSVRANLPNLFTLCNLLCGCIGLVFVSQDALAIAAYLMWAAALLDFADGFVARAVKAYSELGKQLDSLADMVSFGVLPAYIMFALIDERTTHPILPFIAFLIAAFSALRLAKFNIDTRQTHAFIGVPTPANALLISSLPFILQNNNPLAFFQFLQNPVVLIVLTFLLSYLLIANIELMAFKFKQTGWKGNEVRYLFMIITLLLFLFLGIAAVPLIFVLYLILSVANNSFAKKNKH
jgi:CDP-diacylglycerol---serine O-phosphatidyltransferase